MYKELRTTLINGPTFSGKTSFIRRYIDEVISDDVKRDDYTNLICLTEEGIDEINKIKRDKDKTVQYVYTKATKNKSA